MKPTVLYSEPVLFSITESREGQFIWQYKRLIGGFKSRLTYIAKKSSRETVVESRFHGTFDSIEHEIAEWHRGVGLKPTYQSLVTPED